MASIKHMVSLLVFEAVAILPVILIIYWAQKYGGGFSWEVKNMHKFNYHPVFMTIAFVFVMGHAIITFRILPLAHRLKKYIHAILNLVAVAFAIAGLVAVIDFHNEQGYPNFYSLHSWLGLITLSILFLQALGGLAIFQDLVKGASDEIRAAYKPWHIVAGTAMVTLAAATICTGLQEKYGFANPAKFSANAYTFNFTAVTILMWAFTVIYILVAVEKRTPEDEYETLPETHSQNEESIQ